MSSGLFFLVSAGIPDNPQLAETYCSQFEGDFEDISPEKEEDDEDDDDDDEGEGTVVAAHEENMADYISRLEGALDLPSSGQSALWCFGYFQTFCNGGHY